ncbi:YIP1 family protein [Haloarcula sp. GH36]|uniref:YIP1 family protein n=1 Tax=Haloarcula montana TaxID=3111776 RepID=UPI002D77B35C|nr:YIP1 family protein [Haloarcula sp. GH36]
MAPRTPLLRPDSYFANRELSIARAAVLGVLLTGAAVAFVAGLGMVFTEKVDGTVTVDNPDRPPEGFCESGMNETFDDMNDNLTGTNGTGFDCSQPARIERNVDTILRQAIGQLYPAMVIGFPIVIFVTAGLLHAGTAICDASGGFARTLTVTLWGMTPFIVTTPIALGALWLLMDPVTVSPETAPQALQQSLLDSLQPWVPAALALNLVGSLWGAVVWTFGLERARSVTRGQAAAVAGFVTLLLVLLGLL